MIFFLYGPDTFRSREKLKELKKKFLFEVDESSLNLTILDGSSLDIEEFNKAVATPPFLARRRMVIVENLISSYSDQDLIKQVLEILNKKDLIRDILLIFIETDNFKKDNLLFKRLVKEKYAQEFDLLRDNELKNWLRAEVKKRGGKISAEAIEKLISLIGNDLWQMDSEVDKLIAYVDLKAIEEKDVEELVKGKFDDNIFHFIDALATKNTQLAHQLLADQFNSGANELYILTMLIRQFRILLQVKEMAGEKRYLAKNEVATELEIHPFVAQKAISQTRNFSLEKLKSIYGQLLDTDVKIKTNYASLPVLFDLLLSKIMN